ncbi:MAG: terminase small subunit [Sedimentisphaerales bacterium]|nr:terminase small subunit [Sedimentisphaerales bacterium]
MKKKTPKAILLNEPIKTGVKRAKRDTSVFLTPQEELFCSNFCAIGTDTFSRREKSALAADYSPASARNQATALLARKDIQLRIRELSVSLLEKNEITAESVLRNILHDRELARNRGDIGTAVRCDELLGKYLNLWRDVRIGVAFELPDRSEIDPKARQEAARLAEARLLLDSLEKESKLTAVQAENGKFVLSESIYGQESDETGDLETGDEQCTLP